MARHRLVVRRKDLLVKYSAATGGKGRRRLSETVSCKQGNRVLREKASLWVERVSKTHMVRGSGRTPG